MPKRAVVDDPLGELRDAREQLVEIEHRRDLAADLGERLERLGVAAAALEQPRVDERDRDVRGELPHDRDVAFGELVAVAAEDVQRADRPRLVQQRHDDLGVHARHELDVARIGRQVVDEQRLLAGDRRADEAVPRASAAGSVGVGARRVADRVRRTQLAAPLVEQVHGERLERDQPADQSRDLLQQLVEIEDAGDLAAEVEQRGDELASPAGLADCRVGCWRALR